MDPNTTELPGDKRQDEKPEDPVDTRLVGLGNYRLIDCLSMYMCLGKGIFC